MNPHPINKVVNNYFTRAGWGINNEPTPHKKGTEILLYQGSAMPKKRK